MEIFLLPYAKTNVAYKIIDLCDDIDIKTKTRLLEFGFLKGETVKVIGKSLSGGVFLIEIMNTVLTLRLEETLCVKIM